MTSALIIFVKNALLGKVKTRIANSIGDANALKIYQKLLQHTHLITKSTLADKYVFYAEQINDNDLWDMGIFNKELQSGTDLGERMKNAFGTIFSKGYKEVVIIGSDCYELNTEIIQQAFNALKQKEMVIGPAKDGGYYLLGMNAFIPQVFYNIKWSTGNVFEQTMMHVETLNLSLCLLQVLSDVDTLEDVTFKF